jgi:hypothetical protein
MKPITSEKELAKAIKDGVDEIEIEADLRKKVIKIKGKGKVVWAIAIGSIAVAVTALLVAPGGAGAPVAVAAVSAPVAVAILGAPTTMAACAIAVAAGGIGVLGKLRKYKIVKDDGNRLTLKK